MYSAKGSCTLVLLLLHGTERMLHDNEKQALASTGTQQRSKYMTVRSDVVTLLILLGHFYTHTPTANVESHAHIL